MHINIYYLTFTANYRNYMRLGKEEHILLYYAAAVPNNNNYSFIGDPIMKITINMIVLVASFLLSSSFASANVLYDNGPVNGQLDAFTINYGYTVSDSFSLASNSTITDVNFWTWNYPGDIPLTVDWAITSDPLGGTTFASGSGTSLTNSLVINPNQYGYDIFQNTFSILESLGTGTYWLQFSRGAIQKNDTGQCLSRRTDNIETVKREPSAWRNPITNKNEKGRKDHPLPALFHHLVAPQHFLYFFPEPQGQRAFRPILSPSRLWG